MGPIVSYPVVSKKAPQWYNGYRRVVGGVANYVCPEVKIFILVGDHAPMIKTEILWAVCSIRGDSRCSSHCYSS